MSSNTKFIIVGGGNNNDVDADDEQLLTTGGKNVDVFANIFTEQLTKWSLAPAIYSIQSSIMKSPPDYNAKFTVVFKIRFTIDRSARSLSVGFFNTVQFFDHFSVGLISLCDVWMFRVLQIVPVWSTVDTINGMRPRFAAVVRI